MPKLAPMTPADASRLAQETENAYSFDRYRNWRACAALLQRRGYTYAEAECILRSKWTRWAADHADAPYGRATSADLARFLDTPSGSRDALRRMMRS